MHKRDKKYIYITIIFDLSTNLFVLKLKQKYCFCITAKNYE